MYGLGAWDQQKVIQGGRIYCLESREMGVTAWESGLFFSSSCSVILIEPPHRKYDAYLQRKHLLTGQLVEWVELKT